MNISIIGTVRLQFGIFVLTNKQANAFGLMIVLYIVVLGMLYILLQVIN